MCVCVCVCVCVYDLDSGPKFLVASYTAQSPNRTWTANNDTCYDEEGDTDADDNDVDDDNDDD